MKKLFILFLFVLLVSKISFAQNIGSSTKIIVSKLLKVVPRGKKWILQINSPVTIQVSYGTINSGTLCNAQFLSNPSFIGSINRGDIYQNEPYGISFKNLLKIAYTNDYTFQITPISILNRNDLEAEEMNPISTVGIKNLEFKPGEKVFVAGCLNSIELTEVNFIDSGLINKNRAPKITSNTKLFVGGSLRRNSIRISTGLKGIHILVQPNPDSIIKTNCLVVIDVKVDSTGKVIESKYRPWLSSTSDSSILKIVNEKAKQIIFSKSINEDLNDGTITFRFEIYN